MKFYPGRVAAAFVASMALVLTGCAGGGEVAEPEPTLERGGTLTIASSTETATFDPTLANGGVFLQYLQPVYDSLVRRLPDGTLVPMLATEWEYDESSTVLTFTLRDDVVFSDGTALDADAVKFNIEAFKAGNGPTSSSLRSVDSVEAPDATTVVLNLSAPDPGLLDRLGATSSFIASPTAIQGGKIATEPVGSGPYVLDLAATVIASTYTYVKNEDYWDPSLQFYDKIVIKSIVDSTARLNALLSGQVDAAPLVTKTASQARNAGFIETLYASNWRGLLIRDVEGTLVPELAIKEVRQAMAYAIDRETILKQVYSGLGVVTNQIFEPGSTAYDEALDTAYVYDPKKAQELMDEAGVSGFDITFPLFTSMDPAESAAVAQNLADIGINVTWEAIPATLARQVFADTVYPIIYHSLSFGTPWLTAVKMFGPTANYNTFRNTTPALDDLLEPLQNGTEEEQAEAALEINQYLTDQVWYIPFIRPNEVYFTAPGVTITPQAQETVPSIYNYSGTAE